MRRTCLLVFLLLLPLPAHAQAAPAEAGAPDWRVGDRWDYAVVVSSSAGTLYGNLTVRVTADGQVRAGNATVRAYTVVEKRTDYGSGSNTTALTTLHIDARTLCTLSSDRTVKYQFGSFSSEVRTELTYEPSDGRYRFPLAAGENWTARYNLTRTRHFTYNFTTDNSSVAARYDCLAYEELSHKEKAFRIRCSSDGGGPAVTVWYSKRVRGEIQREEYDRSSDATTSFMLRSYSRAPVPSLLSDPDTLKALVLGAAGIVLAAIAVFLAAARRRMPRMPKPDQPVEQPLSAFQFEQTRDGVAVKVNQRDIACPRCGRAFKVIVTARAARCPFCRYEGNLR